MWPTLCNFCSIRCNSGCEQFLICFCMIIHGNGVIASAKTNARLSVHQDDVSKLTGTLCVFLITPSIVEPGPECWTGASCLTGVRRPNKSVTFGTRTTGELPITFLELYKILFWCTLYIHSLAIPVLNRFHPL